MLVDSKHLFIFIFWAFLQVDQNDAVERHPARSWRTLRVLALENPPFIYSTQIGIDALIVKTIAEKFNLTIQFTRISTMNNIDLLNKTYVPEGYNHLK